MIKQKCKPSLHLDICNLSNKYFIELKKYSVCCTNHVSNYISEFFLEHCPGDLEGNGIINKTNFVLITEALSLILLSTLVYATRTEVNCGGKDISGYYCKVSKCIKTNI